MRNVHDRISVPVGGLLAAVLWALVLAAAPAVPAAEQEGQGNAPVALSDQGYFFVGGQYYSAPDGQFIKDQCTSNTRFRRMSGTLTRLCWSTAADSPEPT